MLLARGDQRNLGRPGISEDDFDAVLLERLEQELGDFHERQP
jgi:hypothetical protein